MENKSAEKKPENKNKEKKEGAFKYFLHDFVWGIGSVFGYIWFRPKRVYVSEKAKKKSKAWRYLFQTIPDFTIPFT